MKKFIKIDLIFLFCLLVLLFGATLATFAQDDRSPEVPGHEQLPGVETTVGQWVHFKPANFNIRAIDWAYISEPPKYPAHGTFTGIARRLRKEETELLQIDFEFKNPSARPRKIPLTQLELMLIDTEERATTYRAGFHDYQHFSRLPWMGKIILPGQGNKASFVCEVLPNIIPAKLVIKRKIGLVTDPVIRVFLQQGERLRKIKNGNYDKGLIPKAKEDQGTQTEQKMGTE